MELNYMWKDRKRILGMPISFTRYALSDDRLFLEVGLFNMRQEEVILYRVQDISLSITLWQRLFGVGTLLVKSSDKSMPTLSLTNVKLPRQTKELLHKQVEAMKISRRMRVGEILSDDDCMHDDDMDDDPVLGE